MGHLEKNELTLQTNGPELKSEIAISFELNCQPVYPENTWLR